METHVLTRINLKLENNTPNTPDTPNTFVFCDSRKIILERFVIPAVYQNKLTTANNFKRIAFIDEATKDENPELFTTINKSFDEIFFSINDYINQYKWQEILGIRLDSDDVPLHNFVSSFIETLDTIKLLNTEENNQQLNTENNQKLNTENNQKKITEQAIIAAEGYDYDFKTNTTIKIRVDYPIGFLALYEKELSKWVYYTSHTKIDHNNYYMTGTPLRIRLLHNSNRGSKSPLFKFKI